MRDGGGDSGNVLLIADGDDGVADVGVDLFGDLPSAAGARRGIFLEASHD